MPADHLPPPAGGGDRRPGSARALAADLVNQVLLDGRSLTTALDAERPGADPRRLADAQDLAYGVMRRLGRLRFYLRRLAGRPLSPAELAGPLLVALYELAERDTPAYAAVNEAVDLVGRRHPRARGFANGVLRGFTRRRAELENAAAGHPEARWNFPAWWIDRLRGLYPDTWQAQLTAMNGHPPMTLRVNRRRLAAEDYGARLTAAGLAWRRSGADALTLVRPVAVADLPGFGDGLVSVQDLGAQLAAPLLDCADGMRVLDACAAPGGKAAHLLEHHDLDLVAIDQDPVRLARVTDTLERLGLSAEVRAADAGDPAAWWDGRPFDRILLDAPCTASGVARRHPDGRWLKRCTDADGLAGQQARMLDAVWPLLRHGGKLLYATCSVFPEENTAQVGAFLARHADAGLDPISLPGAHDGQLLADDDHDGFFYARLVKT